VLLKEVKSLPKKLTKKNKVLAFGEVTGHKHQFLSAQVLVYETPEKKQFVEVNQDAELLHEEHKPINIQKGKYEVVIQREFDLVQGVRQVMD
jgi:hypothetical protein